MLFGTFLLLLVSLVTNKLFVDEIVSRRYDVLQCYRQKTADMRDTSEELMNDEQTVSLRRGGESGEVDDGRKCEM